MYCGASVQLETNHNKGYDMEMGRLDARAEIADDLLAKIEKIKPELIRNSLAESRTKEYPNKIYRLKQDLNYMMTGEWKKYLFKPLGIGLVILFAGALVVVIASSIVPKALLYVLEFLVGGAPIYLPVIGIILKIKKCIDLKARIKSAEESLERAKKEYEETEAFIKSHAEVDIPPRFRQERALEYIIKGLKAREFVSLDQAFFRCEEAMTRGEIPDRYIPF